MATKTAPTRPASEERLSSSISTLIVDDYLPWRRAVSSILHSHPDLQVVGEAANGLEALQKVEELKPQLILLDIGLPGISGIVLKFDVAKQLLLAVTAVLQGYPFVSSGVNYDLGG